MIKKLMNGQSILNKKLKTYFIGLLLLKLTNILYDNSYIH